MLNHRVGHKQRIAKRIHRLECSIFGGKHNRLARFVIFVIDEHRATHSSFKPNVLRELRIFDTAIIDADGHTDNLSREIDNAIAHKRICSLFNASILRHFHGNLDTGITTLSRCRISITRRQNRFDGIKLFILCITQMRKQICTTAVIVSVFAKGILERLANAQDTVGFYKRKSKLVVTEILTTPLVCKTVFQRFTQIPIVDFPHGNAACREARIKAAHAKDKPFGLFLVEFAFSLVANTIFEHGVNAIDKKLSLQSRIVILLCFAKIHFHHSVLVPGALAVFNQNVFTGVQRNFHNFSSEAATRSRNIHRHRMASRRAHFLDFRPAHVGAFPCCRQHREKSIARIVTGKVHHVIISEARNSFSNVKRIGHPEFTTNLVHHDTVNAPVQAILRCGFAHHHYRPERINRGPL